MEDKIVQLQHLWSGNGMKLKFPENVERNFELNMKMLCEPGLSKVCIRNLPDDLNSFVSIYKGAR